MTAVCGTLQKMVVRSGVPVSYQLPVGADLVPLNERLGTSLSLTYTGKILCIACGRKTSKSFNQGYCYPCFQSLAQCDVCIVKPEQCHYDQGTCREPQWAQDHCLQPHYVYLANSSGLKVGITRGTQIPTRWIDQGASAALPIWKVANRHTSGLVEVILKHHVADRTDWRAMLKGVPNSIDLPRERDQLYTSSRVEINLLQARLGAGALEYLSDAPVERIAYPVLEYPVKVTALNLDKTPHVAGILLGVKGQYLIFDSGVLNIRKFGGYEVVVE